MTSALKKSDELFNAIQSNNFKLVKQLLEEGANPNRLLLNGVTPFHLAVAADSTSSYKYVKLILQHNGNPNVFDTEGLTPLHIAAQWGKADCLQLLLQCGADPKIRDKEGRDTEHFAQDNKNCLVILDEFNESTCDPFSFRMQQINPADLRDGKYCVDCGKEKRETSVNFNNNITLRTRSPGLKKFKNSATLPVHPGCDQATYKQDAPSTYVRTLSPDKSKPHKTDFLECDSPDTDSKFVLKPPAIKPAVGNRIYLDPSDGSFNTGMDATSPDNCYLFVRSHKRPANSGILDKTVSFSKRSFGSPQCISPLAKENNAVFPETTIPNTSDSKARSPGDLITSEQRRRMLRGTKENVCKSSAVDYSPISPAQAAHQKTEIKPKSLCNIDAQMSVKPELFDDSSFTFAESTVPLECSIEQTQIVATPGDAGEFKTLHDEPLNRDCSQEMLSSKFISTEQQRQMLKATKEKVSDSHLVTGATSFSKKSEVKATPLCTKNHLAIMPNLSVLNDSSFTFADYTLPLDGSSEQTQAVTATLDVVNCKNPHEKPVINKQNEVRERLQSTCHEDFADAIPESFDISQISADDQIFVYSDSDGSTLIEHRCIPPKRSAPNYSPRSMEEVLSPPIKLSVTCDATMNASTDSTVIYDWKSLLDDEHEVVSGGKYESELKETVEIPKHMQELTNDEIRQKLVGHGQRPGPISCARNLYMKRLCLLERGVHLGQQQHKDTLFSHELRSLLLGKSLPDSVLDDDHDVRSEFDNPSSSLKWRGGTTKDSFNYLLLDPRVTNKLPNRAKNLSETECLKVFSGAVFYVGKGKKSRPYAHFKEALKKTTNTSSSKIQHIHDIWSANCGVISLHVFQNVMACEAFTREAAMIEALGLGHLTNSMRGKCYGNAADWDGPRVRRYGTYLVLKSMQILLLEGERQIRSNQISGKGRDGKT